MIRSFKYSIFVFSLVAVSLALPGIADAVGENPIADPESLFLRHLSSLTVADVGTPEDLADADPIPVRLDSWGDASGALEDAALLEIPLLPQGRLTQKPPVIDFDRMEFGAFVGAVQYGSKFKAHTNGAGGFTARVPVPAIPLGDWGLWADVYAGYIIRDLPFFYPHKSGTWYAGSVGGDYTFTNGEYFVLRGKLGIAYNYWNSVQSLDNGFGGTAGLDFGFYWIKHNHKATVDITPQITFSGSTYYAMLTLGFQVEF